MPRANLLNTTDVTLKGLLGNGLRYSVPPYQRDYSWREEHWEDLWLDLADVAQRDDAWRAAGYLLLALLFIILPNVEFVVTLPSPVNPVPLGEIRLGFGF